MAKSLSERNIEKQQRINRLENALKIARKGLYDLVAYECVIDGNYVPSTRYANHILIEMNKAASQRTKKGTD